MPLATPDFDFVRRLVYERSGIALESSKGYLVEARLLALARQEGFASLDELVRRLRSERAPDLGTKVVASMTTNETTFFREMPAFEAFRDVILPELLTARASERRLNIWCAACSSGQEPYSLAMLLRDQVPRLAGWRVSLLASDLSERMLTRAREGRYSQLEVNRGLPARYLLKYFTKDGSDWQLKDEVRSAVEFRHLNLTGAWGSLPVFDVILLRNVMIYFDLEVRASLLRNVRRHLRPDGYLFLGSVETAVNAEAGFRSTTIGKARCYRVTGA